jgi:thioredoxin reductase (NADPH)
MTRTPACEVVVGGGLAGLTTVLYTTRLGHRTALVDREGGRYQSVASVHNLIGVSEDASGHDVSALAIDRLDQYGADVYRDGVREIEQVTKEFDGSDETADFENAADAAAQFRIVADSVILRADRVMLATGFEDVPPRVRGLRRFVGRGLHYCPHCDAYTLGDVTHGQNQTPIAIGDGAYEASRSTGTSGRSPSRRTTLTESRTATCPR